MEKTENKDEYFCLLATTVTVITVIFLGFCEYVAFAYGEPEFSPTNEKQQIGGIDPLVL